MSADFSRRAFTRGMWQALPLLVGLAPFGLVTGVAAQGAGLSLGEAALMSGSVFAGTAQLVALAHWTHPAAAR